MATFLEMPRCHYAAEYYNFYDFCCFENSLRTHCKLALLCLFLCIVSVVERCDLTVIKGKIYLFIYLFDV